MKTNAPTHPGYGLAASAWLAGIVAALLLMCAPCAAAEPDDAVGREFSVFAGSLAVVDVDDATSREFSIFVGSLEPVAVIDAVSREFSVIAGGTPQVAARDAVAREFSIMVQTPPTVILATSMLDYREGDAPLRIDAAALVENPDSTDFGGGFLRVELLTGGAPGDLLAIEEVPGGPISLESGDEVRFEDVAIGTFSGGAAGDALMVTLNSNASIAATQALVRSIAYANSIRFPDAGVREVGFTLADALVGEGPVATREILVEPVNHDPVAGDDFIGAARDVPLVFAVARLLANDSDPDGDPLELAFPDGTTNNGGSIGLAAGVVTYTPPPGFTGTDHFAYTLSDPFGGVDTGMVTAYVRAADDPSVTVLEMGHTGDGFALALVGLPDTTYQGFTSQDLASWLPFATQASDEIGALHFLDAEAGDFPVRFYRFALSGPSP